jgi:hypothetical protein
MKFNLTEKQLNNLKIFLLRTELKGNEVEAFLELVIIFNNPEKETKEK